MTDVTSITFSLYQLFFLGLSHHQKVPVTKKREQGEKLNRRFLKSYWNSRLVTVNTQLKTRQIFGNDLVKELSLLR